MSDDLKEIIVLLRRIEVNQTKEERFNVGTAFSVALGTVFVVLLSLSFNNALSLSFSHISMHISEVGKAWIYFVFALVLSLLALFLIYRFLQPTLSKKFS